ncbi:MAG: CDP-glycerol glycerophosphotransferase family protein [Jatrophihabitans sp.]|uniref:CDP-glycerol glycerophosphotransferase family protein n=1 Tax=Jatrophihabitans sp. TaxID=1932789 RepID=UPI003914B5EE
MKRVMFTGYAPVHFVCFKPLFDALTQDPDVEMVVSGGLRSTGADGVRSHDTAALYSPFNLPPRAVIDVADLGDVDVDILFCANTKPIKPRSYSMSVEMFHGLSFRNRAVRTEQDLYDRYFVLGPYQERRLLQRDVLHLGDTRGVRVGFPKTDQLLDGTLDRQATLAELGLTGERPIVLYAPTGARQNSLETFGEELIKSMAGSGEYDFIVKPHDHPKASINWVERLAPLENEHLRVLRAADAMPALHACDLLISDASSIANEYLLLDRPLVYLDVPELLAAAANEDDRLDLDTWGRKGGVVAGDVHSAQQAIAAGLSDPQAQSDIRRAIAADLFYNPGRATGVALQWLRDEVRLTA